MRCLGWLGLGDIRSERPAVKYGETSFSPCWVFLFSRIRCWGLILWHLWIARARHPSRPFGTEVLNVGRGVDSWGFGFGSWG